MFRRPPIGTVLFGPDSQSAGIVHLGAKQNRPHWLPAAHCESCDGVGSKSDFQLFFFDFAKVGFGPVFSVLKLAAGSYLFYVSFKFELTQIYSQILFLIGSIGKNYCELFVLAVYCGKGFGAGAAFGGAENQSGAGTDVATELAECVVLLGKQDLSGIVVGAGGSPVASGSAQRASVTTALVAILADVGVYYLPEYPGRWFQRLNICNR